MEGWFFFWLSPFGPFCGSPTVFHIMSAGILLFFNVCVIFYRYTYIHILQLSLLHKNVGVLYTCQYTAFLHTSTV